MTEDEFWKLVNGAASESGGNLDKRAIALHRSLLALPAEQIVEFGFWLTRLTFRADRTDLLTAAHLLLSGCGDDGFLDFRYWLISRGRAAFYECLSHADEVATWILGEDAVLFEEFYGIVRRAYHARSGSELPSRLPPGVTRPKEPVGDPVDLREQTVSRRFPKLYKLARSEGPWPAEWNA